MIIHTAEKRGGGIFTDVFHQQMTATRMFLNERGYVMNISSYQY